MKPSTINRVPVTAKRLSAGEPEIEPQIAAPIITDLSMHQAHRGFYKSADGSKETRWWKKVSCDAGIFCNIQCPITIRVGRATHDSNFVAKQACGGQPPTPRDLSRWCQSQRFKSGKEMGHFGEHPASVLVPESAVGLLLSIALSSAQATNILNKADSRGKS